MANNIVAHHNQCLLIVVIPASFFSPIYVCTYTGAFHTANHFLLLEWKWKKITENCVRKYKENSITLKMMCD